MTMFPLPILQSALLNFRSTTYVDLNLILRRKDSITLLVLASLTVSSVCASRLISLTVLLASLAF